MPNTDRLWIYGIFILLIVPGLGNAADEAFDMNTVSDAICCTDPVQHAPYILINAPFATGNATSNVTDQHIIEVAQSNMFWNNITYRPTALSNFTNDLSLSFNVSYMNKTTSSYDGNITSGALNGYKAANEICSNEYTDTHMCNEFEVTTYIIYNDMTYFLGTDAWIIAGSPKYVPATIPVNDCNGFRYSGVTSYLGNYWKFDNTEGGRGAAINCGTTIPLLCCK